MHLLCLPHTSTTLYLRSHSTPARPLRRSKQNARALHPTNDLRFYAHFACFASWRALFRLSSSDEYAPTASHIELVRLTVSCKAHGICAWRGRGTHCRSVQSFTASARRGAISVILISRFGAAQIGQSVLLVSNNHGALQEAGISVAGQIWQGYGLLLCSNWTIRYTCMLETRV